MTPTDIEEFLVFGKALLSKTRERILKRLETGFTVTFKEDESEVTEADREVEELIRSEIGKRYPDHGIVGEEYEDRTSTSAFRWIIDPIDGTQNFTRRIPTFGTILGLQHEREPIVGLVDHPAQGLLYSAGKGLGAFVNGKQIRLADIHDPSLARHELVTVSTPANFSRLGDLEILQSFIEKHHNVRIYGDCFSQTRAVEGQTGAAVHYNVKLWDIGAAEILVTEAGGAFHCVSERAEEGGSPWYCVVLGKKSVVGYLTPFFEDA